MNPTIVLVASGAQLPALKARVMPEAGEVLAFTDAETLRALETITARRPGRVLLERGFAASPRGTALVNRITADPSLAGTQIDIVDAVDDRSSQHTARPEAVAAKPPPATPGTVPPPPDDATTQPAGMPEAPEPGPQTEPPPGVSLAYRGTRRARRVRISGDLELMVDGSRGSVVDLSTLGAQLLTPAVLKPNQRVRLTLTDDAGTIRCGATVVWASFEIPKGASPRYRAGVEFSDADAAALERCARRHEQA